MSRPLIYMNNADKKSQIQNGFSQSITLNAMQPWFHELVDECLEERGFVRVEKEKTDQVVEKCSVLKEEFTHRSCPGAIFSFIWIEVNSGYRYIHPHFVSSCTLKSRECSHR